MDVMSPHSVGSSEPSPALHNGAGIYSPLDKSKSEIRLLTLSMRRNEPSGTEKLHASIETFSFNSGNIPTYYALSYEWNPPNTPITTEILIINGKEKHVSSTLYYALLTLSVRIGSTGQFWVDALCINQEDTAERSHQVQLMRRIYGKALCVYVWLGIRWIAETEKRGMRLIREYETQASKESLVRISSHFGIDENYKDHREAIISMFSQSYWNRSWIIQELVAANLVLLLTGDHPVTSKPIFLEKLMIFFRAPPPPDISVYDRSTNWAAICPSAETIHKKAIGNRINAHHAVAAISRTKRYGNVEEPGDQQDLLSLLARFCGQLATDRRDKVYSLLGIEEPNSDNCIRVDYTLKWTEVFRDAAIHVIRDRNDLEVLVYGGSSVTELPSWVPDWLDQERQGTTRFPHDKYCVRERCCSPHTAQTSLCSDGTGSRLPTISADGSLLTISASLFNIQLCSNVDSPDVDMEVRRVWAPLGELSDMMLSTWRANSVVLDDSDGEFPDEAIFESFIELWWHAMFYFHPAAVLKLSVRDFNRHVTSLGQYSLTESQRELLQRALGEQFPFLTKVPPSVGSAIFASTVLGTEFSEMIAQRILDRNASVYIPGMCFWSSERGTLGPNHVLASIPLCRFPIILSKSEGSGTNYKVTTSARVAGLVHGQIQENNGTIFEIPVQEIDLV